MRGYGERLAKALESDPTVLAPLSSTSPVGSLRRRHRFMYQGIFDTDFDKYTEDAVVLFGKTGIDTAFENLEGFPRDWKTNTTAFVKFLRPPMPELPRVWRISLFLERRDQEGSEDQGRPRRDARADAVKEARHERREDRVLVQPEPRSEEVLEGPTTGQRLHRLELSGRGQPRRDRARQPLLHDDEVR